MIPLPGALGGRDLVAWRLDQDVFASTWDSGEGSFRVGGRWNHKGIRAVYCAIDPSTAILDVAVHKTFRVLDTVAHVLTSLVVTDPSLVHVVDPGSIPNPIWLRPGLPSDGQQAFGDDLLAHYPFVLIPSAVSMHTWNLLFDPTRAGGAYRRGSQEPFALDTRLHPPLATPPRP